MWGLSWFKKMWAGRAETPGERSPVELSSSVPGEALSVAGPVHVNDGAVAMGDQALAVGAGGVAVRGNNTGIIQTLIVQGTRPGASPDDLRRAYLAVLLRQLDHFALSSDTGAAQMRLSSVYTALLTERSEFDQLKPGEPTKRSTFDLDEELVMEMNMQKVLRGAKVKDEVRQLLANHYMPGGSPTGS